MVNINEIPRDIRGHYFLVLRDTEHFKKDDIVWSGDFTGFKTMGVTPDGRGLLSEVVVESSIIEISGCEKTKSGQTWFEEVHIEMLEYLGVANT